MTRLLAVALFLAPIAASAARPAPQRDVEQGGAHWRLETSRGALHVWRPSGYRPSSAATVIYLHGYFTDVDGAWRDHDLALQFRASGRNALFIVAESPRNNPDPVRWSSLEELLKAAREAGVAVPSRQVVVVAHSGAFRTVVPWLRSPLLDEVVLLDGLYNNLPDFAAWLQKAPRKSSRRLVLVGFETAERSELFVADFPDARIRDGVPSRLSEVRWAERQARLLYVRSQYGHMELVTEGRAIPMLLKMGSLPAL